jgi:flagellar hook-associated protein 2
LNALAALGVRLDDHGHLNIDDARLSAALAGQTTGVSLNDVRSLFALSGTSTNNGIQFVVASSRTQPTTTGYQVEITQAATQASLTATTPLVDSTAIDSGNNSLTLTINGQTATITLQANPAYTRQQLAQELQSEINSNSAFAGRQVSVGLSGNSLTITSAAYGSAARIQIDSASTALGFAGTESGRGTDVVGNFVVNGTVEAATGTGQFLSGNSGNAHTADLQVLVTLTQGQIAPTPEATVTMSRGVASGLGVVLGRLLDPATGRLKTINDGFQSSIDDIKSRIDEQNNLLASQRQRLVAQFAAMEQAISQIQSISSLLSTQFGVATSSSTRSLNLATG